jgi:Family of unknown function (DUF5317)
MLKQRQYIDFSLVVIVIAWNLLEHTNRVTVIGCAAFALGFLLNRLVLLFNEGYMLAAVTQEALPESLRDRYKPIESGSRLVFFSDWIRLGRHLISPGDILIVLGLTAIFLGMLK